jgi:hypothetical protein
MLGTSAALLCGKRVVGVYLGLKASQERGAAIGGCLPRVVLGVHGVGRKLGA